MLERALGPVHAAAGRPRPAAAGHGAGSPGRGSRSERRPAAAAPIPVGGFGYRSTIAAIASPPPMHSVARPRFASCAAIA